MALDLKEMERDILEATYTLGEIGVIDRPNTPASELLLNKYPWYGARQQMNVLIRHLLEERYLFPAYSYTQHKLSSKIVNGITPKGLKRLRELEHPWRT